MKMETAQTVPRGEAAEVDGGDGAARGRGAGPQVEGEKAEAGDDEGEGEDGRAGVGVVDLDDHGGAGEHLDEGEEAVGCVVGLEAEVVDGPAHPTHQMGTSSAGEDEVAAEVGAGAGREEIAEAR